MVEFETDPQKRNIVWVTRDVWERAMGRDRRTPSKVEDCLEEIGPEAAARLLYKLAGLPFDPACLTQQPETPDDRGELPCCPFCVPQERSAGGNRRERRARKHRAR